MPACVTSGPEFTEPLSLSFYQVDDYLNQANEQMCLLVQAETAQAIQNLPAIAAVATAAVILVGCSLVILARASAIGWPAGAMGLLAPASWAIAAFLVLNTLGNLASKSRLERTVFAATTAALAVLSAYVALS